MTKLASLIEKQNELSFLRQLLPLIFRYLGPTQVTLFGSRARDDYHRRSDVDILVTKETFDDDAWAHLRSELEELPTLLSIDLVRNDQVEENFLNHIRSEGIVIHE